MSQQAIEDIYELSPLQRGMLFHTLYARESRVFVEQESFPLYGGVDVKNLIRAWHKVVERHPVLRSSFHWEDLEKPVQVVHRKAWLPVDVEDWKMFPGHEQDERLHAYLSSVREQGFDLSKAPLIRLAMFERSKDIVQYVLSFHHILLDGWSSRLITQEVWAHYEAYCDGKELRTAPVRPYGDFIAWLQQQDPARAEAFWRRVLKGFVAPTPLGIDHPPRQRPEADVDHGVQSIRLSKVTSAALQSLARENRLTINTLIQGAWAFVLSRYSRESDVVFGTVVSGRPATLAGVESMVGLFINTLPLRTRVLPDSLPIPWMKDIQAQQLEAREYEYSDLVNIQRWSDIPPGASLFESIVIFENYPVSDPLEGDDPSEENFRCFEKSNYPLNLMVMPGVQLELKILYSQHRFDAPAVARMLAHVEVFLQELAAHPDRSLAEFPILTPAERRNLLVDWNATGAEYPRDASIHELFEAQVARTPDGIAFVCEEAHITYAELNSRCNRLARHLQSLGVGPEVLVGICIDRSFDFMVALLATFKAGGAYLPLDPGYPKERLAFMVKDAKVNVLLTLARYVPELPVDGRTLFRFDVDSDVLGQYSDASVTNRFSPQQLAYVIYTSGSTGEPKGVAVEHTQLLNRFYWMWQEYPFATGEVGCQKTAASFVDSIWEFFGPLLKGIPAVIIRDEVLRDASRLVDELARHRVTRIWLVPSLLSALLDLYDDLQDRLPSLTFWVTSGEALTPALFQRFREQMPFATLYNLYGTSEVWDATWFDPAREAIVDGQAPIGRPIYNVRVYILDERLQPVPIGVPGELCVGGIGLARGYLHRPDLTAAKFIADPFSDQADARLYKTGDLARYLPDGNIEFLGRLDRQIKIRGFRIEPGEVEAVLAQHPSVQKAVVVARHDASGEPFLAAYVVRSPDYDGSELGQGVNSWSAERVHRWQEVWDEIYSQTPTPDHPTLNLGGWNSSYTGLPIPADEMYEWINRSVESVLSFKPKSVLEIGCGAGLLLFRIAPHCDRYCGTDFSPSALRHVGTHVRALNLSHVDLLQRVADDFTGFDPGSFDVVILNSTTQYFPTIDYLLAVVEGALSVLRSGGAIYLGAVRSLPLLEAFHASVELHQASALLTIGQLRQRVRKRVLEEDELAIDPAFFHALRNHFPQIERVQVAPKRGRFQNELTRFRYEVVLYVSSSLDQTDGFDRTDTGEWLDWRRERMSLPAIRQTLDEGNSEMLRIARIPNGRLGSDMKALELLARLDDGDTVGDLRDALRTFRDGGVDPEDLWELEEKTPYSVDLQCPEFEVHDCFHALIRRRWPGATPDGLRAAAAFPREDITWRTWSTYANNPLQRMLPQVVLPELRRFAQTVLPHHMVPSTIVFLDSFPLTPSGKLDFAALPAPDRTRPERKLGFVAARTRTERILASTWTDLLGVEQVGAHDNFFQLGGHSLVAIRLLSRMREAFQLEVPLRAIFETPTLAGLAQLVEDGLARGEEHEVSAIVRLSRDAHAATMLPGGVLNPADLAKGRHKELPAASPGT